MVETLFFFEAVVNLPKYFIDFISKIDKFPPRKKSRKKTKEKVEWEKESRFIFYYLLLYCHLNLGYRLVMYDREQSLKIYQLKQNSKC